MYWDYYGHICVDLSVHVDPTESFIFHVVRLFLKWQCLYPMWIYMHTNSLERHRYKHSVVDVCTIIMHSLKTTEYVVADNWTITSHWHRAVITTPTSSPTMPTNLQCMHNTIHRLLVIYICIVSYYSNIRISLAKHERHRDPEKTNIHIHMLLCSHYPVPSTSALGWHYVYIYAYA